MTALAHQLPLQSVLSSGKRKKINQFVLNHIYDLVAVYRLADLSWEYVNSTLLNKLGYSCEELYDRSPLELVHTDDLPKVVKKLKGGLSLGEGNFEFRYRKQDGSYLWLQVKSRVLDFKEEDASLVMICQDITADKEKALIETERGINLEELVKLQSTCRQLDRTVETMRRVITAVMNAENEEDLLNLTCQAIIETGEFSLAWIGFRQNAGDKIQPVAHAGHNFGFLAKLNIHLDDPRRGWGPTGIAIRTGQPVVSNYIKKDERFAPWVKDALRRGYKSNFTVPLQVSGKIVGVLSVYGDSVDRFNQGEQKLLQDVADWLGFGLASTRHAD